MLDAALATKVLDYDFRPLSVPRVGVLPGRIFFEDKPHFWHQWSKKFAPGTPRQRGLIAELPSRTPVPRLGDWAKVAKFEVTDEQRAKLGIEVRAETALDVGEGKVSGKARESNSHELVIGDSAILQMDADSLDNFVRGIDPEDLFDRYLTLYERLRAGKPVLVVVDVLGCKRLDSHRRSELQADFKASATSPQGVGAGVNAADDRREDRRVSYDDDEFIILGVRTRRLLLQGSGLFVEQDYAAAKAAHGDSGAIDDPSAYVIEIADEKAPAVEAAVGT